MRTLIHAARGERKNVQFLNQIMLLIIAFREKNIIQSLCPGLVKIQHNVYLYQGKDINNLFAKCNNQRHRDYVIKCFKKKEKAPLTFHLFDTSQRILERVDGAGLALAPFLRRQVRLQLLEGLEQLLLSLRFGRLLAAAGRE